MTYWFGEGRYNPEVEIVKLEDDYIEFFLTKADLSFANSLRRTIIAEVPDNGNRHGKHQSQYQSFI